MCAARPRLARLFVIVDFRSPTTPTDIRADICLIGAGAAGITMARALADSGLQVCLIEAGGLEPDGNSQDLYNGSNVGQQLASPTACRLRFFGGTTNHWQGWCAPMPASDLLPRPWVAGSGWPILPQQLEPWYARARPVCEIGPTGREHEVTAPAPAFDPGKLTTRYWHFSPPTRFGHVYRETLKQAHHVTVYLNCNLVGIETNPGATEVRRLRVRTLDGRTGYVKARAYVLASGGMENARILMLANDVLAAGLGNASGALGRRFMQHIELTGARLHCADGAALAEAFRRHDASDGSVQAHPTVSPDAQRSLGLLNCAFSMGVEDDLSPGYKALSDIYHSVKSGRAPEHLGEKLWTVSKDLDDIADRLYKRLAKPVTTLNLTIHAEQRPNDASRISLTDACDVFGQRKLQVNWQLTIEDRLSIMRAVRILAEELGRMQIGRLELLPWLASADVPWPDRIWSGCHHMGTTRMSAEPATGVVDPDCRVHGVANLYVAGSSVFPTGGYVPPTLTIVALALRLADHLKAAHV